MRSKDIDALRESMGRLLSNSRYNHTLGVERMAVSLGEVFLPDRIAELRVAALLHDVAKELTYEDMKQIISEQRISVSDEDLATLPALHSFAGVALVQRDYPDFASPDILSAIRNHTLGSPDMSLFDKIIYISDYIEMGRTHISCEKVRMQLLRAVSNESDQEMRLKALNKAIIASIDFTAEHLSNIGATIHPSSVNTKNAFLPLI